MLVPRGRSSAGGGRRTRYRLAALCKRHRAPLSNARVAVRISCLIRFCAPEVAPVFRRPSTTVTTHHEGKRRLAASHNTLAGEARPTKWVGSLRHLLAERGVGGVDVRR